MGVDRTGGSCHRPILGFLNSKFKERANTCAHETCSQAQSAEFKDSEGLEREQHISATLSLNLQNRNATEMFGSVN